MSILLVPATTPYPPGYGGNPYTPSDISIFEDMNWPPVATGLKSTGFVDAGLMGLRGLGCDDEVCDDDGSNCECLDSTSPTTIATAPPSLPVATPVTTVAGSPTATGSLPAGMCYDLSGNMISCSNGSSGSGNVALTPAQQTAIQAQMTPAQQAALIAATGNSAVSLIRTAEGGPYTVAGTNLVYNPATGQLSTTASVNATAALTGGLASIGPYLPMILLAIGAIIVIPMITGKK